MQRKTGEHGGKEGSVQLGADPWNSQPPAVGEGTGTDIEEVELHEELHKLRRLKRVQFPPTRQNPRRIFLLRAVPVFLTQGQFLPEALETQS